MLASTVTEEETSRKPVGIVKQYGEPAGEIFEPPQLSVWRPESSGVPEPFGLADAAPGLVAFAAGWPLPATVLAQPASRPHRPSRASAKRLRMRATVSGAWGEPRIPSVPVGGAHIGGGAGGGDTLGRGRGGGGGTGGHWGGGAPARGGGEGGGCWGGGSPPSGLERGGRSGGGSPPS